MESKKELEKKVVLAAGEYGSCSALLRNATSRKLGLNIADMECLGLLFLKGISSPTEIARYTGLTTGSTTAMLDRLEKAELIARKPNPNDRRGLLIEVNENLASTVGPTFAGMQKIQKELIASYSDKELKTIADFLTCFTKNALEYAKDLDKGTAERH